MSDARKSTAPVVQKFAVAMAGILHAFKHENSFLVHLPMATAVVLMGLWLQLESWRWVAITFCITLVISAELLNTAIEELVAALHPQHDVRIGRVLDLASGAVLVAAAGAVVAGLITLVMPLWKAISPHL
ncbi:MAG: diacylglycerol kinase [Planctomycetota bacterium]|nr:diacylglycerol kinase [Planctomycetota bacterium]